MSELSNRLKNARNLRAISQAKLAATVGVGTPYISKIEQGKETPSEKLIDALAAALSLDPDPLLILAGYVPRTILESLQLDPDWSAHQLRVLETEAELRTTGGAGDE